jgi:hypothetical protein
VSGEAPSISQLCRWRRRARSRAPSKGCRASETCHLVMWQARSSWTGVGSSYTSRAHQSLMQPRYQRAGP